MQGNEMSEVVEMRGSEYNHRDSEIGFGIFQGFFWSPFIVYVLLVV